MCECHFIYYSKVGNDDCVCLETECQQGCEKTQIQLSNGVICHLIVNQVAWLYCDGVLYMVHAVYLFVCITQGQQDDTQSLLHTFHAWSPTMSRIKRKQK